MKSFNAYLTEDKDRFIKKNVNLNNDQKDELMKFFRINKQAEKKIDWQKSKTMTYDDFVDVMIMSRSGRKTVLKHKAIKGSKEGTDYIQMRMPDKEYLAYVPLNYETAQKFNTREMGVCSGDWCIGHSSTPDNWNSEVIQDQQIPIYVINRYSKWVVMIQEGNRKYDVWSIENSPSKKHEGIPNFSIRKNLLNSKQRAMYDEIRDDYYSDEAEHEEIDVDDATTDYDNLVSDIEDAVGIHEQAYEDARDNWNQECDDIKRDTKDEYDEAIDEAEELWNSASAHFDILDQAFDELESEVNDWDAGGEEDEPLATNFNEPLSLDELERKRDEAEEVRDNAEVTVNELQEKLDKIDKIDNYEMEDADIDWSEDPPSEDYIYDDLDYSFPSVDDGKYSDYIELAEEYMGFSSRHSNIDSDISLYCMNDSNAGSAEEVLGNEGLYHPDYVNEH